MKFPQLSVKLPRFLVIQNTRLALFQFALQALMAGGLVYLTLLNNGHLTISEPQGYPHGWSEQSSNFATTLTSDLASADYCNDLVADKYQYYYSASWVYGKFRCTSNSDHGEDNWGIGVNGLYFPTYFQEDLKQVATTTSACSALQTSCQGLSDYQNAATCAAAPGYGKSCFTNLGAQPGGQEKCTCSSTNHYFVAAVSERMMKFNHYFNIKMENGEQEEGLSTVTQSIALEKKLRPILSIVYAYSTTTKDFVEYNCGSGGSGMCRFLPGEDIGLTLGQWLDAAGESLDSQNTMVQRNVQYVAGSNFEYPSMRITGLELLVELEYVDHNFHDVQHGGKKWEYIVCKIKITSNKVWTGMPRVDFQGNVALPTGVNEAGASRYRFYEGIKVVFSNSKASRFAWPTFLAVMNTVAVMVVYFGVIQVLIFHFAAKGLGETSRTYSRALQTELNIPRAATKGLPSRLVASAASFFSIVQWQNMQDEANKTIPNFNKETPTPAQRKAGLKGIGITRDGIEGMLRTVFAYELSIDESETQIMTDAIWKALSGGKKYINLQRFLEATTSQENVDFKSVVSSYDADRKLCLFERCFGDGGLDDGTEACDLEDVLQLSSCCTGKKKKNTTSPSDSTDADIHLDNADTSSLEMGVPGGAYIAKGNGAAKDIHSNGNGKL